jgi:AraC family transcriptional regulator of adaptative response/methylated-DNA-[protein]-cysteine methyltransferase
VRQASEQLRRRPEQHRYNGLSNHVRYTIGECYLGRILLAATPRGVCAVSFADTDRALLEHLTGEFSENTLTRDDRGLAPRLTELLQSLVGAAPDPDFPLDIRGTPFQLRVWKAMRKIPRGQTRSYQKVAGMIRKPLAARAVARACAFNPAMVVIPCHRVIANDGSVRGSPDCIVRRRMLLEAERERM